MRSSPVRIEGVQKRRARGRECTRDYLAPPSPAPLSSHLPPPLPSFSFPLSRFQCFIHYLFKENLGGGGGVKEASGTQGRRDVVECSQPRPCVLASAASTPATPSIASQTRRPRQRCIPRTRISESRPAAHALRTCSPASRPRPLHQPFRWLLSTHTCSRLRPRCAHGGQNTHGTQSPETEPCLALS